MCFLLSFSIIQTFPAVNRKTAGTQIYKTRQPETQEGAINIESINIESINIELQVTIIEAYLCLNEKSILAHYTRVYESFRRRQHASFLAA